MPRPTSLATLYGESNMSNRTFTTRNSHETRILSVRPMVRDDLAKLDKGAAKNYIKRIRNVHHLVARLAASGLSNREISESVGYSQARLSVILSSPAMVELCAQYRNMDNESWLKGRDHFYDTMSELGTRSARIILDNYDAAEESGEVIPVRTALSVLEFASDRTGYHKKQTNVNVNVDFAARLEDAIKRSRQATIEHQQLED